jgi:hypothetical protein
MERTAQSPAGGNEKNNLEILDTRVSIKIKKIKHLFVCKKINKN